MKTLVMAPSVGQPRYSVSESPAISAKQVYAFAGPGGSVALPSGSEGALADVLNELEVSSWFSGDAGFKFAAQRFKVEISRPKRDRDAIRKCWIAVEAAATFNGAFGLVERIGALLQAMRLV